MTGISWQRVETWAWLAGRGSHTSVKMTITVDQIDPV